MNIGPMKAEAKCKGIVYKCYENLYYSNNESIEYKKSIRKMKSLSCKGCEKCGWESGEIKEGIANDCFNLYSCEDGKLYRLNLITSQGFEDIYMEVDGIEFMEIKKEKGIKNEFKR